MKLPKLIPNVSMLAKSLLSLEARQAPSNINSALWSGAITDFSCSQSTYYVALDSISATWTVPTISPASSGAGTWYLTQLIGVDGWNGDVGDGSGSGLYAGVAQTVTVDNNNKSTFFTEAIFQGYPGGVAVPLNFTVSPGDNVSLNIYFPLYNIAQMSIENTDTGAIFNASLPQGIPLARGYASFLVMDSVDQATSVPLANFEGFAMGDCASMWDYGNYVCDLTTNTVTTQININNNVLVYPNIQYNNGIMFTNVGAG